MSKHQKALKRLLASPPPADLEWSELKSILEHLGYRMLKNSGSRRKFFHPGNQALIICHEPHPKPIVDRNCIRDVVEHLRTHRFVK